jgi:hypothetical protein
MDPRYRDVKKEQIPELTLENDVKVKVVCGEINGIKGPVQDIITEPEYLDVVVPPNTQFTHQVKKGHNIFAYVIDGEGYFDSEKDQLKRPQNLVIYQDGGFVQINSLDKTLRFLLISGKPIGEPIAWRGPIVMNTNEELMVAFQEYQNGTFIKHKKPLIRPIQ